ncbi:hypothetical protein F5Y19DRAFT_486547 [Xylariaceae sp. FL1651]|nr:hypothetical protein F5Y19DRAFT_486547 [Xylariaceae sp. FL1651]
MDSMRLLWSGILAICLLHQNVYAFTRSLPLDERWENHQQCIEMGAGDSFTPATEPSLILTFQQGFSGVVSIVMFELGDEHLGGIRIPGTSEKAVLCNEENINRELCSASQAGEFLISDSARRRANHEFITRAVNISEPISIIYHVSSPGYYCTAAIVSSGHSFSATMLAIDPGSPVAAFRAGSRAVYRLVAPLWLLLASVWTMRLMLTRRGGIVCWLVPLSALQVLIRSTALETGDQGLNAVWGLLWYFLASGQYLVISLHTWGSVATAQASNRQLCYPQIGIALAMSVFQCAASWTDFNARADSRGPSYINVLYGSFLFLFLAMSAIQLLLRPFKNTKIDCQGLLRVAELGLCGALVIVALLFLLIAVASLWILLKRQTPQEFASSFWQVRSWLIDSPRDYIFMLWTCCLVVYNEYKDTYQLRSSETHYTGLEEMELFRDTAEDPRV